MNYRTQKIFVTLLLSGVLNTAIGQKVIERPQLFKRPSPYERYTTYRVSVNGGLGMPAGTFKNYMGANARRNYTIELDFVFPQNNLSAGVIGGLQYFKQRLPRQVYNFDDGAISAVQTRTFSAYTVVATGSYHLAKVNAPLRPYLQAGLGGAFAEVVNYWGLIPTGNNGFRVVGQIGGGLRYLFNKNGNFGLEASANYLYIPFRLSSENIRDASSLNARVGVFYRWW
ncbi:MAG: outer membrane protein [Runella sp.]